jgi:ATP-dependent exoDNAse (exonuclease V) beta subunit
VRAAQLARKRTTAPSAGEVEGWTIAGAVARQEAQRRGLAAHAYLALVDLTRGDVDEELLARVSQPDDRAELRARLRRLHQGALGDHLRGARHVDREVPITYRDADGRIVHGVIDLLFEDADGTWHVLDWKTDRHPDPERHAPQLAAYARGVQLALGLEQPPRAEAVFLQGE